MAQLVERPTEKPGAILTRVRVLGAANDFSPSVNFQCILCSVEPPCAIACINICAQVTNPNTNPKPYHCLDTIV